MKKLNSVELKDKQSTLLKRCKEIVDTCKKEIREMTDDEKAEFDAAKAEIASLKGQLDELKKKLETYEVPTLDETEEVKEDFFEEDPMAEEEVIKMDELKSKRNKTNKMRKSIVKEIRSAIANGTKNFKINADTEKRAIQVTGNSGVQDEVVETEIQGILEPLYAKSVLAELGVKWYTGLPQGDIQVPIMGKGTVGWASEVAAASAGGNAFSGVLLQPKRLTAYVDISKQLLNQDTIGVENAIRRDIVNAINDKLEATIFSADAGDATKPAGIFYDSSVFDASTFKAVVDLEAKVEKNNVYGDMKYLLSTGAKADLRAMPKSTKNTQLVMEGGEIDGTPAVVTSNVAGAGYYAYGNFENLAVASWGDIDITVDEYTQAVNGCVRLVVNAYFDAKKLRKEAFIFGKTR